MTERDRKVLHSSRRDNWCTPLWFVELLWQFGDVVLDPCSNARSLVHAYHSARRGRLPSPCPPHLVSNNGLTVNWHHYCGHKKGMRRGVTPVDGFVYVNPPYGRLVGPWVEKCRIEYERGAEVVALLPARVDTQWYQGAGAVADVEVCGRLTFAGATSPAPFPSSVVYWGERVEEFAALFGPLGRLHVVGSAGLDRAPAPRSSPPPETTSKGTPAALYHRVSTVDQNPDGAQLELYQAAELRGLVPVLEVKETGSGATNDRPGLQRVLEAAKRGKVRAVLVWKLDRFGRSALDVLSNLQLLEQAKCRFIASSQGIDVNAGGDPMSRFMIQMLSAVAEFERTLIAERTLNGIANARRRGVRLGRPPTEGPPAARVRALRDAGHPWRAIAAELGCSVMKARRAAA